MKTPKTSRVLAVLAVVAAGSGVSVGFAAEQESAIGKSGYPLVVFRQTGSIVGTERQREFFRKSCEVHAKYKGAFDDFWMGGGVAYAKLEVCKERLEEVAKLRPFCEKAGVTMSYQQGHTLGHGHNYVTPMEDCPAGIITQSRAEPFPDDAWMVNPKGVTLSWRNLCPRSPYVHDYMYKYAKQLISIVRPYTYWPDDDCRLDTGRVGCFCPRCIAAFNRQTGESFDRNSLTNRLFGGAVLDPIRLEWIKFNEQSLAEFAKPFRKAADEVMPECRIALQTISSCAVYNGRDYGPILKAFSGDGRVPSGTRPGHGCYTEMNPRDFLEKALWCTRESEKCRKLGNLCGTVCYEQETFTRKVLHKSPNAIVNECALALASGCDTISLYWADGETEQTIEDYERFVRSIYLSRPYFERLSASTKRTSLGGVARYLGSRVYELKQFWTGDKNDQDLAMCGIPVTVAESAAAWKVWYTNGVSCAAMVAGEAEKVRKEGLVDFGAITHYPQQHVRRKWLDEIDRVTNGRFPVRVDLTHALRVLPRIDKQGKTDSVSILNLSIGGTDEFTVKIRNPRSTKPELMGTRGPARPAKCAYDAAKDELVVTIPDLPGWQIATVFL